MNSNFVITRHAEVPRAIGDVAHLQCIVGYYGIMDGRRIAVTVGTGAAGDRMFHYGDPAEPREPFRIATPEMVAGVRTYGFRDGMPDGAVAE